MVEVLWNLVEAGFLFFQQFLFFLMVNIQNWVTKFQIFCYLNHIFFKKSSFQKVLWIHDFLNVMFLMLGLSTNFTNKNFANKTNKFQFWIVTFTKNNFLFWNFFLCFYKLEEFQVDLQLFVGFFRHFFAYEADYHFVFFELILTTFFTNRMFTR